MRKTRFIVAALIAVLGIAAAAYAQSAQTNSYDVTAKVAAGGTKTKPKAGGFKFGFSITDPNGNVPAIIKTYTIGIEGTRVNSNIIPGCKSSQINAAQSASKCPAKSLIGTGTVKALVGTTGQPASSAATCNLAIDIYNSRSNKAALYVHGGPPQCISSINQAFDGKWTKLGGGSALQFTVPDALRHQLGLDIPTVASDVTFKKIVAKKGKKKVGYFESIGCQDKSRTVTAQFVDENGGSQTVTKDVGGC